MNFRIANMVNLAVWLNFWTEANERSGKNHAGYYLGIYAALQVLGVLWFALLIW